MTSLTRTHLRGVCPVLEVPFHDDESLDLPGFQRVVAHTLGTGVTAVMFPGFASEHQRLSGSERRRLGEALLEQTAVRPDVAAVLAVQDPSTGPAVRAATTAVEAGADAVNLLAPAGPADVVATHLGRVLAAVAPVPVVLQHAPAQTGAGIDPVGITALAGEHPNLVAVKVEATPPGRVIAALAGGEPSLPSLVGYAGLALPDARRRGAIGVQPGCSFTELYVRCWRLWDDGDVAAAEVLHRRMLPWLSLWMQSVDLVVAAEKLVSARRGLIASSRCRAPAYDLDEVEVAGVDAFLAEFADELAAC